MVIEDAVILAGGLGMRLRPLTNIIPKPLLPIGESTVLEIQILALKKHGVKRVFIATNYMSDYLQAVVGDGGKYGVEVIISREDEPLGTAGPLSLIKGQLNGPFFVMNGDILTDLNFTDLGRFALDKEADLTVVTKEIAIPFRFGRVITNGDYLIDVEEKPSYMQEILAGIYVMKPGIFSWIPDETYFGVDTLIKTMIEKKSSICKYLMDDYWIDIGQLKDYEIAREEYATTQQASSAR